MIVLHKSFKQYPGIFGSSNNERVCLFFHQCADYTVFRRQLEFYLFNTCYGQKPGRLGADLADTILNRLYTNVVSIDDKGHCGFLEILKMIVF